MQENDIQRTNVNKVEEAKNQSTSILKAVQGSQKWPG